MLPLIATQAGEEIARAAPQFGQKDDITVLTPLLTTADAQHA
jgi:hypothetical protein